MALPLPAGLLPPEIAFLCEMELVTVIPRQRLESLQLLGGSTPVLRPPHRADLPLWLALLLKRQRRASIVPPPWLHTASLTTILEHELSDRNRETFSESALLQSQPISHSSNGNNTYPTYLQPHDHTPPFQPANTATAPPTNLPYHFLELGQTLLTAASDDIPDAEKVRQLLRDLREVRMAKVRAAVERLHGGGGINMSGIGALELGEGREFLGKVVDGLRKIGASREREDREAEEDRRRGVGGRGTNDDDDDDEDMQL